MAWLSMEFSIAAHCARHMNEQTSASDTHTRSPKWNCMLIRVATNDDYIDVRMVCDGRHRQHSMHISEHAQNCHQTATTFQLRHTNFMTIYCLLVLLSLIAAHSLSLGKHKQKQLKMLIEIGCLKSSSSQPVCSLLVSVFLFLSGQHTHTSRQFS